MFTDVPVDYSTDAVMSSCVQLFQHEFLPLGTSAEGVMSLPPSVRPSVRPSVCLSVCLSVRPLLACLRDNSSSISPIVTKFAPIMHLVNLQTAFENGVD